MNMDKGVIEVDNLTKEYKKLKAVDGLSFTVYKGEILGLLGPNGSGKSTTINCILSLLNFQEGSIKILGQEMNVENNIDYFCGLYITDKAKRKQYVNEAIELVGLKDFKKFYPKQLSGGLLRRLNIACGIAHKPEIIFLDEPTVAVDPQSRNHILDGIKKLRENGATIIYTTHYMEEVEILCDRIIILDKGKIIASGTSDELKKLATILEKISVEVCNLAPKYLEDIRKNSNVKEVCYDNHNLVITYYKGKNNLAEFTHYLEGKKIHYNRIFSERPTLNDVFLELTGKGLRD